jgi:hypothetical protein
MIKANGSEKSIWSSRQREALALIIREQEMSRKAGQIANREKDEK